MLHLIASAVVMAAPAPAVDQARGFDFLHGEWAIEINVRAGADAWSKMTGTVVVEPILDGGAHREILDVTRADGQRYTGSAVRVYHAERDEWTVSWVDNATRTFQQAAGRFDEWGVGRFHRDTDGDAGDGMSEWAWYPDDPRGPRFEIRNSGDGGETWGEVLVRSWLERGRP